MNCIRCHQPILPTQKYYRTKRGAHHANYEHCDELLGIHIFKMSESEIDELLKAEGIEPTQTLDEVLKEVIRTKDKRKCLVALLCYERRADIRLGPGGIEDGNWRH